MAVKAVRRVSLVSLVSLVTQLSSLGPAPTPRLCRRRHSMASSSVSFITRVRPGRPLVALVHTPSAHVHRLPHLSCAALTADIGGRSVSSHWRSCQELSTANHGPGEVRDLGCRRRSSNEGEKLYKCPVELSTSACSLYKGGLSPCTGVCMSSLKHNCGAKT